MPLMRPSVTAQPTSASRRSRPISPSRRTSGRAGGRRRVADATFYAQGKALTLHPPLNRSLLHLAGELVGGGLGIDRVELYVEDIGFPRRPADSELRSEAESGVLHRGLWVGALGTGKRLEGERVAPDRERRSISVGEGHLASLGAEVVAVEAGEHLERAACLAAHDPVDRIQLLVRDVVVDDHADRPVAGTQIRREDVDQTDLGAAEIHVVEIALADVEDEIAVTLAVRSGWRSVGRARAEQLAVAGRKVSS